MTLGGEIFESDGDVISLKIKLLQKLSNSAQKEREIFLQKFTDWLSIEREHL